LPREQLLVVCPWPPLCASPGKVVFRLDELVGVMHDDDPVFMKKAFEESCADLPHADVISGVMELLMGHSGVAVGL